MTTEYFTEIIVPPSEKKIIKINKLDIPNNFYNKLIYWVEYHGEETWFMVNCPLCGAIYRYSIVQSGTDPGDLLIGIEDNERYFQLAWEEECPKRDTHAMLVEILMQFSNVGNICYEWDD
jgi:hypothetical protein